MASTTITAEALNALNATMAEKTDSPFFASLSVAAVNDSLQQVGRPDTLTEAQLAALKAMVGANPEFFGGREGFDSIKLASLATLDNLPKKAAIAAGTIALNAQAPSDLELVIAWGWVVFDVVCLAIGGVSIRAGASRQTAQAIGEAVQPMIPLIEKIFAGFSSGTGFKDQAVAAFNLIKLIWTGGDGGAVFNAFMASLTWYQMALYGVTGAATIAAAVLTDGAALIAEIVIELATFGFFINDIVHAISLSAAK